MGGRLSLVMGACWAALSGAVVSGGLVHLRRRWIPWLAFLAAAVLMLWFPVAVTLLDRLTSQNAHPFGGLREDARDALAATGIFGLLVLVMLLGIPFGAIGRRAILRRDVRRFGRVRTRIRTRRTHG